MSRRKQEVRNKICSTYYYFETDVDQIKPIIKFDHTGNNLQCHSVGNQRPGAPTPHRSNNSSDDRNLPQTPLDEILSPKVKIEMKDFVTLELREQVQKLIAHQLQDSVSIPKSYHRWQKKVVLVSKSHQPPRVEESTSSQETR